MAVRVLVRQHRLWAMLRRDILLRAGGQLSLYVHFAGRFVLTLPRQPTFAQHPRAVPGPTRTKSPTTRPPARRHCQCQQAPGSGVGIRTVDPGALSPNQPSFLSQLKVYNGTFCEESVWKIFLRPFPFLLSPVVRHVQLYLGIVRINDLTMIL